MPNQKGTKGTIVLMGSGELTATMVEVHKALVRRFPGSANAVFIDTPAGFQLNADHIARKAEEYFKDRVQHPLQVASFKSADTTDDMTAEKAFGTLRNADYILIGPGSPTYAIDQWRKSPIPDILHRRIEAGGCLVSASAAALTMGRLTLPVYEIYKVGQPPHWVDGLDILGRFGLNLVVVPHWNNAEGGNHDTRFCFMGDQRIQQLQALLPDATPILGLDEHTALVIDLARQVATIRGIGTITLRIEGRDTIFTRQDTVPLEILKGQSPGADARQEKALNLQPPEAVPPDTDAESTESTWNSLHALADRARSGLDQQRPDQATAALMEMERLIWRAREQMEEDMSIGAARDMFREILASLGTHCSQRPVSSEACLRPVVEALLDLRLAFRSQSKWSEADALRDLLQDNGLLVEDTAQGTQWRMD